MTRFQRGLRIVLYLYFAKWLPEGPMPGGRFARRVRGWVCGPLFREAGRDINVERGAYFGDGSRISIGDRSSIGINARLHGPVTIGNDVMMGPDVVVQALRHTTRSTDVPMIDQGFDEPREVVIEDDVWIGTRAIFLPGVRIGTGVVVGAGAVVTKSVSDYSIVAGVPARVVGSRLDPDPADVAHRGT